MKLIRKTTSPYVRFAKIALIEKGVTDFEEEIVNPWRDAPSLLAANTAARVPALITDEGTALPERWLIFTWLEKIRPEPSLLQGNIQTVLRRAGQAFGVIEAAVHTIIGRVIASGDPAVTAFDAESVGLRRRRSILSGFAALAKDPPSYSGVSPELSVILTVIALDYADFRFAKFSWMESFPPLDELRATVSERPAFKSSLPHD